MDRLTRKFAGLGLALTAIVATAGCHNVRDKVPPHQAFSNTGKSAADKSVEFSTAPHDAPLTAGNAMGGAQGNLAPSNDPSSVAASGLTGNSYGNLSTNSKFGGPGTSGLGAPPAMTSPAAPNSSYPPQPPARSNEVPNSNVVGQPNDAPSPY